MRELLPGHSSDPPYYKTQTRASAQSKNTELFERSPKPMRSGVLRVSGLGFRV